MRYGARAFTALVRDIHGKEGRVTVRAESYAAALRQLKNGGVSFLKWVQK